MIKYIKLLVGRFNVWMAYNPPWALSGPAWNLFNKEFKRNAPIRYWLHHDFKQIFVYPVRRKYSNIADWIRYRTYDKYHLVDSKLQPGYYQLDTIMLHANFNMLKDFVEVETAIREYWISDEKRSWYSKHMPFYRRFYPFRRPDLGIHHLEWASTLDDPSLPPHEQSATQAIHARETLVLYRWWVDERPMRKAICPVRPKSVVDDDDDDIFSPASDDTEEYRKYLSDIETMHEQRNEWDEEDDIMLVRLVKIRRGLWT